MCIYGVFAAVYRDWIKERLCLNMSVQCSQHVAVFLLSRRSSLSSLTLCFLPGGFIFVPLFTNMLPVCPHTSRCLCYCVPALLFVFRDHDTDQCCHQKSFFTLLRDLNLHVQPVQTWQVKVWQGVTQNTLRGSPFHQGRWQSVIHSYDHKALLLVIIVVCFHSSLVLMCALCCVFQFLQVALFYVQLLWPSLDSFSVPKTHMLFVVFVCLFVIVSPILLHPLSLHQGPKCKKVFWSTFTCSCEWTNVHLLITKKTNNKKQPQTYKKKSSLSSTTCLF